MQQELNGDRIAGPRRRRRNTTFRRRALRFGQQIEQHVERRFHGGDDAAADGRYRGRIGIVDDLEDRGCAVEDRGVAFDVKREHRRADHDHRIIAAQRV